MRIAYDNLLKTATTLTSANEDSNYPVERLYHAWKKNKYMMDDSADGLKRAVCLPQPHRYECKII